MAEVPQPTADTARERAKAVLVALVDKFAGPNLLAEIADGDSQALPNDGPKHLAALHDLRDNYGWSLHRQPNNHWYPSEPVELISYAADHHSQSSQVFCNALLMIADLDGAGCDVMHFRWFHHPGEAWFRRLNDPWGSALLAGFAVLHRAADPYERENWARPQAQGKWIEEDHG